jgi:fucose permease
VAAAAGARFSSKTILFATLSGALAASVVLIASTGNASVTIVAVLLTGFFFGPIFPSIFAITTGTFRKATGSAASRVTAMGSLGAARLPWLQGILLVSVSPSASVVLVAIGAVAMLVLFGGYNLVSRRMPVDPVPA